MDNFFFKNQSFEHDIIIYNFIALSVSLCLYHRDLIKSLCINSIWQTYKHKKDVQNVFGHMIATYKNEVLVSLIG